MSIGGWSSGRVDSARTSEISTHLPSLQWGFGVCGRGGRGESPMGYGGIQMPGRRHSDLCRLSDLSKDPHPTVKHNHRDQLQGRQILNPQLPIWKLQWFMSGFIGVEFRLES